MTHEPPAARVLVVDDEPNVLHAVSRVLGRRHQILGAATGAEAIAGARSFRPDLAVVDVRLPDVNGFEVTRALKSSPADPDVILMTGDAEEPDEVLIRAIEEGAFYFIQKPFDRRVLLALVGRCLELRRLREEKQRALRRMEDELREAREFQMGLLPPGRLDLPRASLTARYRACQELAGDFYDFAEAGPDAVALIVADVVGHGASAAMMTSLVKSAFRASGADGYEPASVVARVRESIRSFDASRFITLVAARCDLAGGRLDYVGAGHPSPIVSRPGAPPSLLAPTGPLLSSALDEMPCDQRSVDLGPGADVLFYTDGVTEARDASGEFGPDRLVSLVAARRWRGGELLDRILAGVSEFTGGADRRDDDMTLLVLETSGP